MKDLELLGRLQPALRSLLRAVTGALFMQHGVRKLFGLLLSPDRSWSGAPEAFSQMWFAGVLEVFGGGLIVLGLFTRPVAFVLAGEMAVAYFQSHAPRGPWPILNGASPPRCSASYSSISSRPGPAHTAWTPSSAPGDKDDSSEEP